MPGIPHLSGAQSFNSDLFRTGTAEAAAQQGNAAAGDKAQANAVQAAPEASRGQRGADPDADEADIRDKARLQAANRQRFGRAEPTGDVVRLGGDRREAARAPQADLFANPFAPRPKARVAAAPEPAAARPGVRPEFVDTEETPPPRQLQDVKG